MKTSWFLNFHQFFNFFSSSICFNATLAISVIKGALAKQKKWVDARFNTFEQFCFPSSRQFVYCCSISIAIGIMAKLIEHPANFDVFSFSWFCFVCHAFVTSPTISNWVGYLKLGRL
jgi:hypothetical protein